MSNHKKIKTTEQIWKAIRNKHQELKVFSSYSAPGGDFFGNPDQCVMMTEYGFDGCDYPIIGAETTWDRSHEETHERINERHEYWLCVGINEDE